MTGTPRIAVILPVYNGEKYLAEAVRSVLDQTLTDFELIIIDDGSTDRTAEILAGFSDARLRVIHFPENQGLVAALNLGIEQSRSELIARMDADDICLPHRFARQAAFLDSHPYVQLCGTWTRQFGGETIVRRPPTEAETIRVRLFFGWAMDHPSIMCRRSFLDRHRLRYDPSYRHVEDFDFFLRAAELGKLANLPEVLLRTRAHAEEISVVHLDEQIKTERGILARELKKLMPDVSDTQADFHLRMLNNPLRVSELSCAHKWLHALDQVNSKSGRFNNAVFRNELRSQWYRIHAQSIGAGIGVLGSYRRFSLPDRSSFRPREYAALSVKLAALRVRMIARICKHWLSYASAD